jgi:hypothetical protein
MTATKIAAESSDSDPEVTAFHLFQKSVNAGTKTATFVQAESADTDSPVGTYKLLNAVHSNEL